MHEPKKVMELICPIMCEAGSLLLTFLGKDLVEEYKDDFSIVTKADRAIEAFLIDKLAEVVPEANFLAEESGESGKQGEYQWVIDPLDGTTNFAHGFPYFSISVALAHNGVPIVGAIYNPLRDEIFTAYSGGGAYLNGAKITVSAREDVKKLLISFATPCAENECDWFWEGVYKVTHAVHSYRKLGSAALDMAYVACGRLDAALFGPLRWWDIAAGLVIVQEAGGKVSEFDKDSIGPGYRTCLSSSTTLHKKIKKLL